MECDSTQHVLMVFKISIFDAQHAKKAAEAVLNHGVIGSVWAHHLYYLACNAWSREAVNRLNQLKGRPLNQVLASPGNMEDILELADLQGTRGLKQSADIFGRDPESFLNLLTLKYPIMLILKAKNNLPPSIVSDNPAGKVIWIASYQGDRVYRNFLTEVRQLRKKGEKIILAGSSLNKNQEKTLTVKEYQQVEDNFGDELDFLSVHPGHSEIKKLRFSASATVIDFTSVSPTLKRVGSVSWDKLKKYIPNLA